MIKGLGSGRNQSERSRTAFIISARRTSRGSPSVYWLTTIRTLPV